MNHDNDVMSRFLWILIIVLQSRENPCSGVALLPGKSKKEPGKFGKLFLHNLEDLLPRKLRVFLLCIWIEPKENTESYLVQ